MNKRWLIILLVSKVYTVQVCYYVRWIFIGLTFLPEESFSLTPRVSWWVIKAGFQPLYPGILVFHSITTQLNLLEEWFSHKYHLLFVCNKHPPLHMSHFLPPMNKQSCMIWLLSVLHTLSRNTHKHITHWVIVLLSTMSGFLVTAKIFDTKSMD